MQTVKKGKETTKKFEESTEPSSALETECKDMLAAMERLNPSKQFRASKDAAVLTCISEFDELADDLRNIKNLFREYPSWQKARGKGQRCGNEQGPGKKMAQAMQKLESHSQS